MNDYYTHRKFLIQELEKLNKENDIHCLEFGTGEGSALVFKDFLKKISGMKVSSYENNYEWLNKTKERFFEKNYNFLYVEDWDKLLIDDNFNQKYDLIFVDQSPWEARIKTIDVVGKNSKIIILHDYDYYNKNICEDIFSVKEGSFFYEKYSKNFELIPNFETLPPTLIMINKLFK